jgi:hypothetical protein
MTDLKIAAAPSFSNGPFTKSNFYNAISANFLETDDKCVGWQKEIDQIDRDLDSIKQNLDRLISEIQKLGADLGINDPIKLFKLKEFVSFVNGRCRLGGVMFSRAAVDIGIADEIITKLQEYNSLNKRASSLISRKGGLRIAMKRHECPEQSESDGDEVKDESAERVSESPAISARPAGAADVMSAPLTDWQLQRQLELQIGPDALRVVQEDMRNQQSYTMPPKDSALDFRFDSQPFYDPNKAMLVTGLIAAAIATAPEAEITWPALYKVAASLGLITLLPLADGAKPAPASSLRDIALPDIIPDCIINGRKVTLSVDPSLTSIGTFLAFDIKTKAAAVSKPLYRGNDGKAYVINISNDLNVVKDLHYRGFDKDVSADPAVQPQFEGKAFVLSIPRDERGNLFPAKARLLTKVE